jgi:hypothetical protein
MPSPLILTTPHAQQVREGVTQSPRRFNRLHRLVSDDGSSLVLTDHDAYCAGHEFDLVASSGLTRDDLAEIHAYIVAEVIIPTAQA